MYPIYKPLIILSLVLLIPVVLSAQSSPIVKGRLVQGDGNPLPFATASFYNSSDSSMVNNALTENNGSFQLELPAGEYYAIFQYVGFQDGLIEDIMVQNTQDTVDLGNINMSEDAIALQEVEVRAERSQMELKLDRRVFNVGKDLTGAGNTAADILDNVPSVTVDTEGNVSLRGSQNIRILVDGKPSGLISAGDIEALRRLQGDIIESIEVITNPSARYEAEGEAGIINIILKKNEDKGFNGSFGATVGYPHNYGGSYNLNYRQNNLNFFSNFGLDYQRTPGGGKTTQRFFENGVLDEFYTVETDQERGGVGGNLQFGADWYINPQNTITGSVLYRHSQGDNTASVVYRDFDSDGTLLSTATRDNVESETEHNFETALNYKKTFDQEDREWTIDFKYILDDDTEIADYIERSDSTIAPLVQRSSNTEDETNLLFQTDYIQPIGENSKIEGGLRAALRTVNNNFQVEEEGDDGDYFTLPNFDDNLEYTEDIYAAYFIGATEFSKLGIQAGVRAELSDITAALLKSGARNDQDYFNLFPSTSISYNFSPEQQMQISYSRRISRPYFRLLLPFSNFNDRRNNRIGNPNLRPEFTDSYEVGFLQYLPKGSLLSSIYYRHTTGVIQRLTLPSDDGTTIRFPVNLSTRNAYGFEISLTYDFYDWWRTNADANVYREVVEGEYENVEYGNDTYTWNGRINNQLDMGDRMKAQISFDYDAPQQTPQGRELATYSLNVGLSLDILNNKGTLTLSGRDLFNTDVDREIVDLPNFESETRFQWRQSRRVVLNFSYRLNQDKQQADTFEDDF